MKVEGFVVLLQPWDLNIGWKLVTTVNTTIAPQGNGGYVTSISSS